MASSNSSTTPNSSTEKQEPSVRHGEAVDRFVTFWGKMASQWGINPTMAQVYALLYCVEQPLNTDDIMERLQISRGSANMNLRSLVDWSLVEQTTVGGSRKDHYVAETDVWTVTARIIEKREEQEVQPVRKQLQAVAEHLVPGDERIDDRPEADQELYRRLQNLIELIDVFDGVTDALLPLVKNRNEVLIQKLIAAAESFHDEPLRREDGDS